MTYLFNKENFQKEVLESEKPVLVDFYAPWCPPCNAQGPIIDDLAKEFEGKLKIGKLNIEEAVEIAQDFNVLSIPTLIFFKNGKEIKRLIGLQTKEELKKEIKNILSL
jgi:thioredoxin 1